MGKRRPRASDVLGAAAQAVVILLTVIGIVVIVFPIVWMVFASARPLQETLASPPMWLPREPTFQFYYDLIFSGKYRNYLVNGYFIGLATTGFCLLLGVPGAYGFSRYRIKGGGMLLMGMVALRMVPGVALIIPYFRLAQTFGLFNTYPALILAHSSVALPFVVWLLKSYFDSIPRDLEEAAMVDGASRLGALYRVVLPLVAPGLVGTGVMAFLASWSELLLSVILTSGQKVAPLTVGVALFFTEFGRDWGHIMALNTLGVVPLMVIFVFLQRYVVQGITAGAVK